MRLAAGAALVVGFMLIGVARAQEEPPLAGGGLVVGEVDRCVNGIENPASGIAVGIDGGSGNLARTDSNGQFLIVLLPGQYTIIAHADDGTSANRPYVPVEAGQALDIGILDLGGGLSGCGPDVQITEPILPTFTPTQIAVVEATPTALPTSAPTATAVSGVPDQQPAPAQPAPDQPAPPGSPGG